VAQQIIKLLDSSVWIEIFSKGKKEKLCLKELEQADKIIVPTVIIFEVYKKLNLSTSEDLALKAIAFMSGYEAQDLTRDVALTAADLAINHKLAMADSLVLAHAQNSHSTLVTMDNDFSGINNVKIIR
jgi:predicted nucleic acid-binding protein